MAGPQGFKKLANKSHKVPQPDITFHFLVTVLYCVPAAVLILGFRHSVLPFQSAVPKIDFFLIFNTNGGKVMVEE